MPTLTIPDVPATVYADLQEQAAAGGRTVEEEALARIAGPVKAVGPTGPAPHPGERPAALPLVPELFLSPEIPAPFDLDPVGPAVPVKVRDAGPARLEFWFDEDKGGG